MILVTGGTGFIGSHTVSELLKLGREVIIVDNLVNSSDHSLDGIEAVSGKRPVFVKADLRDKAALEKVFSENQIESVIHFAGLKAVGESVEIPIDYYDNNIGGTLSLLNTMISHGVKKLVFSSSATVYGMNNTSPLHEDMQTSATNPYGKTKLFIEHILNDLYTSDKSWSIAILRYFNPVGADASGLIGESPNGIPNNIMPVIARVASGQMESLTVFGNDYDTPDGSCVRDYIHITDLAKGHIKAIDYLETGSGIETVNLGTGHGYSVFELISTFEKASGKKVAYEIGNRRPGDVPVNFADPTKAKHLLGWQAELGLDRMCEDAWRWQQHNI